MDALKRVAASNHIDICPFFDLKVVQSRVNALPDTIELNEESAWEILFEEKLSELKNYRK